LSYIRIFGIFALLAQRKAGYLKSLLQMVSDRFVI
jgi:hypothetical protein